MDGVSELTPEMVGTTLALFAIVYFILFGVAIYYMLKLMKAGPALPDVKHDDEPDCAVNAAVADGRLDLKRLDSMKRLVAEEAALEAEQRTQEKAQDKRGVRKVRPAPGKH